MCRIAVNPVGSEETVKYFSMRILKTMWRKLEKSSIKETHNDGVLVVQALKVGREIKNVTGNVRNWADITYDCTKEMRKGKRFRKTHMYIWIIFTMSILK